MEGNSFWLIENFFCGYSAEHKSTSTFSKFKYSSQPSAGQNMLTLFKYGPADWG